MSNTIRCHRCNHENDPGARVCVQCYARISDAARSKVRMGVRARLASIPLGKFVPVIVLIVFLALFAFLSPSAEMDRAVLTQFGLLGLVALGVTFPLTKGHYDFSCGPVAGLAACLTIIATQRQEPFLTLPIPLTAAIAGIVVGLLVGLLNGLIVGWTRVPSAVFTIIVAVGATELAHTLSRGRELTVGSTGLQALGEASFAGIPAPLMLLLAAALVALLLWRRETFWPLSRVSTRKWVLRLTAPGSIIWSFAISGIMAGLAGVFIAACGLPVTSPLGHSTWILAPITAAILGGGVVAAGIGGVGTALSGAAALSVVGYVLTIMRVPIAGPVAEGLLLGFCLLNSQVLGCTWYEFQELRRGNLLGIPGAQRVPDLLFHSRYSRLIWVSTAAVVGLLAYGYVAVYRVLYVPEDQVAVVMIEGDVRIWEKRVEGLEPLEKPATMHALLKREDRIATAAGSECMLRLSDGSHVHLGPGSDMRVIQILQDANGTRDVRMNVTSGSIWAEVEPMLTPESQFEVSTPLLTVAVRGTQFHVEVGKEKASVGVLDGAVSLLRFFTARDQYGQTQTRQEHGRLLGGEGLMVEIDLPLGRPYPLPEAEANRMRYIGERAGSEVFRALFGWRFIKALAGIAILVIGVWALFTYGIAGPARTILPEDVDEAVKRLDATRTRTADDSPRAVAIAQMHMQLGNTEEARAELRRIVQSDATSRYGQWAERMLAQLEPGRPEEPEQPDEGEGGDAEG